MSSLAEIMARQGARSHGHGSRQLRRALADEVKTGDTTPRHVLLSWVTPNAILLTIPGIIVGWLVGYGAENVLNLPQDSTYAITFGFGLIGPMIGLSYVTWLWSLRLQRKVDALLTLTDDQLRVRFRWLTVSGLFLAALGGVIVGIIGFD